MDRARVIQVVEATLSRRGDGEETPIRIVTEYFSTDGELLAERDPWQPALRGALEGSGRGHERG